MFMTKDPSPSMSTTTASGLAAAAPAPGEAEALGARPDVSLPRLVKLVAFTPPTSDVPDAGGNDGLALGHLAQELHGVLRDDVIVRLGVRERELGPLLAMSALHSEKSSSGLSAR